MNPYYLAELRYEKEEAEAMAIEELACKLCNLELERTPNIALVDAGYEYSDQDYVNECVTMMNELRKVIESRCWNLAKIIITKGLKHEHF